MKSLIIQNSPGLNSNSLSMFSNITKSKSRNNTVPFIPKSGLKKKGLYHHPSMPVTIGSGLTWISGSIPVESSVKQTKL